MNAKIVTMDVKNWEICSILSPKQDKKTSSWKVTLNKCIAFKANMDEKSQKVEGENNGLTKDINNMRAVIETLAPSLEEEGTKTIKDLKRQIYFFLWGKRISIYKWRRKKHILTKIPKSLSK